MDDPKVRNEFGLDKENAADVQKERLKSWMPWVLVIVAILLVVAIVIIAFPKKTSKNADIPLDPTYGAAMPRQG